MVVSSNKWSLTAFIFLLSWSCPLCQYYTPLSKWSCAFAYIFFITACTFENWKPSHRRFNRELQPILLFIFFVHQLFESRNFLIQGRNQMVIIFYFGVECNNILLIVFEPKLHFTDNIKVFLILKLEYVISLHILRNKVNVKSSKNITLFFSELI